MDPFAAQPEMPQPPMGGTGAATNPRPQMGNASQAMTLVFTGLEAFQKALPGLPMGSEIHTAVLNAVSAVSRRLENQSGDGASQIQALAAMGRDVQQNPQADILQKLMSGGGQPQPPAMPA